MDRDDEAKKERQADIVMQIAELAAELDWCIALPDADSAVGGMIMGTTEWIKENGILVYGPAYVIFTEDPMTGHLSETAAGDDGDKLH